MSVTPPTIQVSPGPLYSAWVRDRALCGHMRREAVLSPPPFPEVGLVAAEHCRWLDRGQASVLTKAWPVLAHKGNSSMRGGLGTAKDRAGRLTDTPLSSFPRDTFPRPHLSATSLQSLGWKGFQEEGVHS